MPSTVNETLTVRWLRGGFISIFGRYVLLISLLTFVASILALAAALTYGVSVYTAQ